MSKINNLKIPGYYKILLKEMSELMLQKEQIKLSSNSNNERFNKLRNAIKPLLLSRDDHTIVIDNLRAVLKQGQLKRTFRRDEILDFLRENYGEDVAKRVDDNCTIVSSNDSVYLYRTKPGTMSENDPLDSEVYHEK